MLRYRIIKDNPTGQRVVKEDLLEKATLNMRPESDWEKYLQRSGILKDVPYLGNKNKNSVAKASQAKNNVNAVK